MEAVAQRVRWIAEELPPASPAASIAGQRALFRPLPSTIPVQYVRRRSSASVVGYLEQDVVERWPPTRPPRPRMAMLQRRCFTLRSARLPCTRSRQSPSGRLRRHGRRPPHYLADEQAGSYLGSCAPAGRPDAGGTEAVPPGVRRSTPRRPTRAWSVIARQLLTLRANFCQALGDVQLTIAIMASAPCTSWAKR